MCDVTEENPQVGADTAGAPPIEGHPGSDGLVVRVASWLPSNGRHFAWFDDCNLMAVSAEFAAVTADSYRLGATA